MRELQPFQQRVVEERDELAGRTVRLRNFLHEAVYAQLPKDDRNLLRAKFGRMNEYLDVLNQRIARFQSPEDEMVVFRKDISSDSDPLGSIRIVAMPVARLSEHGIPPLPRGHVQMIANCLRKELAEKFPGAVQL